MTTLPFCAIAPASALRIGSTMFCTSDFDQNVAQGTGKILPTIRRRLFIFKQITIKATVLQKGSEASCKATYAQRT